MSVYIKGMEMPVFEHQSWDIRKGADGKWYMVDTNAETSDGAWHEIVPVPEHGRLIDRATLRAEVKKHATPSDAWVFSLIRTAPTIIPASGGNKNE